MVCNANTQGKQVSKHKTITEYSMKSQSNQQSEKQRTTNKRISKRENTLKGTTHTHTHRNMSNIKHKQAQTNIRIIVHSRFRECRQNSEGGFSLGVGPETTARKYWQRIMLQLLVPKPNTENILSEIKIGL